jgi:hypothetical protein
VELADQTLYDRFTEARQQNLPGIPRNKLLRYLYQAADGLDILNTPQLCENRDLVARDLNGGVKTSFVLIWNSPSAGEATVEIISTDSLSNNCTISFN